MVSALPPLQLLLRTWGVHTQGRADTRLLPASALPALPRLCSINSRASAARNLPGQMCLRDLLAAVASFDSPGQLGIWSVQSKRPAWPQCAQAPGGQGLSLVPAEPGSCRPLVAPGGAAGSCPGPLTGALTTGLIFRALNNRCLQEAPRRSWQSKGATAQPIPAAAAWPCVEGKGCGAPSGGCPVPPPARRGLGPCGEVPQVPPCPSLSWGSAGGTGAAALRADAPGRAARLP